MGRVVLAMGLMLGLVPGAVRAETPGAEAGTAWKPALYVDAYKVPEEDGYVVPTIFLDRGPLHLEGRYNYEDFDTASLHAGWGFTFGGEEKFAKLTPMLGGVFGNVNGMAPGLEIEARWGRVAYWLESEYLIDFEDSAGSYLYTWSELNFYALDWLWLGGSLQRFKALQSPTEVDVGPMIGAGRPGSPGWGVSFYAYGLTRSAPTYLLTLAVPL